VKRLRILPIVSLAALLAGCAATNQPVSHESVGSQPAVETASVSDSLAAAEGYYRQALAHYVRDDWDAARPLLTRALSQLDSLGPQTEDSRQRVESLRARIRYFLGALASREVPEEREIRGSAALADTLVASPARAGSGRSSAGGGITVVRNERVEKWLRYFQGKGRSEMARWLSRSGRYRPMIEQILAEEGLPDELFYLAMIESGLNPNAYSSAHAAGMWQFIGSRARMYGLRVDWWVDERRDPEKSTRAACAYLKDLYGMFGSWELALAGYNSGEGRVSRARKRRPSCRDFWCLDLPRETENFVPKFMAAALIGSDPEAYGFSPAAPQFPFEYDTIAVTEATDLAVIADAAGVSCEEIRRLNPAIRRWCTPPSDRAVEVHVPAGTGSRVVAALARIPDDRRVTWTRHKISRGETLSEIASAYGTTIKAILSVNDIRNPHRIRAGDYIVVPIGPGASSEEYAGVVTYRVRPGDTISSIARRYGKRTKDVLRWNGLTWHSRIYPGDVITIRNM